MENQKYPIGFWNILNATAGGEAAVQDWVDFGTTLTMSGVFRPGENKAEFLWMLDRCYEYGIRILITDARASYMEVPSGHYEENAKAVIADFAGHPAVYGFHLGDEPGSENTENAIAAVQTFRRLCPEKEAYLNLLPWYDGAEERVAAKTGYKDYLIDFVRRSGIRILSYDCYFQLEERHGKPIPTAWDTYYKNLRIFKEVAEETGVQLWYTTLAVGHMYYRCPTQDDIRWEINTAAACGVQALFYWFLYSGFYNANYRAAPINEVFQKTQTFDWISAENHIFQEIFGTLFTELQLEQVYHTVQAFGGYPLLEESEDPKLKRVYDVTEQPLLISRFHRNADPDHYYYAIVCNSVKAPACVYAEFQEELPIYEVRSTGGTVQLIPRGTMDTIQYWFSPGQMWVVAVPK